MASAPQRDIHGYTEGVIERGIDKWSKWSYNDDHEKG